MRVLRGTRVHRASGDGRKPALLVEEDNDSHESGFGNLDPYLEDTGAGHKGGSC